MTEPNTRDFSDFNRQLRAYLARRVDAAFVDDILGEILLRVAEHRDRFDRAANPLAWLYKVAGNLVADHYRRRAVEKDALQQLGQEAPETDAGEADHYRELAQCLQPMIEALPADYRDALLLTDLQGLPQAEAAARTGLSVSGMKSRVQRGRAQLKEALYRCCEIELNRHGRIVDYTGRGFPPPCDKSCG